jgi:hypothetical protein
MAHAQAAVVTSTPDFGPKHVNIPDFFSNESNPSYSYVGRC